MVAVPGCHLHFDRNPREGGDLKTLGGPRLRGDEER